MPENTKMATLNQKMIRRMVNTSELVDIKKRLEIIDNYAKKLINSEYDLAVTRRIIVGGLKGYERMLSVSLDKDSPNWKPLHLPTSYKAKERKVVKMMAKTNWFKSREEQGLETTQPSGRIHPAGRPNITPGGVKVMEPTVEEAGKLESGVWSKKRGGNKPTLSLRGKKRLEKSAVKKEKRKVNRQLGRAGIKKLDNNPAMRKGKQIPTISVLFVEQTPGGALAKSLQKAEVELGMKTGYRVRIVENAGSALKMLLPSTNPWGNRDCQRLDCIMCNQGDERTQDCRRRNIMYENRCTVCQVGKDGDKFQKDGLGIYVGETSRSMYERSKEHEKDRMEEEEDSHQMKHWVLDHPELDAPPRFKFQIISSFSDPLTRQISEAVRIEQRGEMILNSKSEFNRCRVPRLKIDMEGWKAGKEREKQEKLNKAQDERVEISQVEESETGLKDDGQVELELSEFEAQSKRMENKRKRMEEPSKPEERKRKEKKRKFARLVNWGEVDSSQVEADHQLDHPHGARVASVEDWVTKHGMEDEKRTRDWVFTETLQPEKRLKQMRLDIPILAKKAGKENNIQRKVKSLDKSRKKISMKEGKEVKKTSMNIFDWFCDKQSSTGASLGDTSPGTSLGAASPVTSMEVEVDTARKEREEKEERLRRMLKRKESWLNKMMVKEVVLELIDNTSNQAMMGTCGKMLEGMLSEAIMRADIRTVMRTLESIDGMEARMLQELNNKEVMRRKDERLAKKLEMELRWLSKRRENDTEKMAKASRESLMMEWEEHDLEYMMTALGLEEEDLFRKEERGVDDWLDDWIMSLDPGEVNPGASMEVDSVDTILEVARPGTSMDWLADDTMVEMNIDVEDCKEDYMTWLMDELRGMKVEDEIIEMVSECVRSVSCPGGCQDRCVVGIDQADHQGGSSLLASQGSTHGLEEGVRNQEQLEEYVRNAACPGDCHGNCRMKASQIISDSDGSQSMQGHQGKAQDMLHSFDCRHKTQEFGVPRDKNLLESRRGRVGVFACGRNCIPRQRGGSGGKNVSTLGQTVQTHSTVVQPEYHSMGVLDWTGVGGVVHEGEGGCMNNAKGGPKYVPNCDILPRWEHPHFKPNCSRRHHTIYAEDTNGDTISSPHLLNKPEGYSELWAGRRGSRLSGRVGEEVRRLEEGGEGGEHVQDQGVVGGKRKHGEEDKECILLTEGGGGWEGGQRKKRKGGRVSNLMNTFEQGDRQRNKITFYTLKNYGHPSAGTKLCASGAVERLCESDIVRSASKRAKISR
jgi:hypothetical protein